MKTPAAVCGSDRNSLQSGSASSIASMPCWRLWELAQYNPLRRDRRQRLDELRTALGDSLPPHARAKIARMLDRLELLLAQITALEQSRDAVLENENPDKAAGMIQQLAKLRGVGVQSATVLVREGFVREFANGKALGSYAGLTAYSLQQWRH